MTVKEVFLSICQKKSMSQADMSRALGYDRPANVSVPLSRNDGMGMKVDTFIRWAEALGYQVVLQSEDSGEDEFILDGESELE